MSLAKKIAQNTLIHTFGRAISTIMALVVVAIMTRALGPDGFGGYSTIIAFLQFFGITVDFGLTLTANRMLGSITLTHTTPNPSSERRGNDIISSPACEFSPLPEGGQRGVGGRGGSDSNNASRLMSNLMTLRFVSAFVFLGIAPIVALFFPYSTIVKQAMFLTSFSFLAIILGQTLVPIFQRELKMSYVAISEIAGRVVLLAGVALSAYLHLNLLWFMGAMVLGSLAQYAFIHRAVRQFITLHWSFDYLMWKQILITSWPIGISIIFNLIYLKADTIMLSVMRPQAEVGFYGASYRVVDQFTALATMFVNLVLPPMTATWVIGNRERFAKLYQGAFDAYSAIAFPLMIGALLIGQPLMIFIAGADFAASGTILGIHMLAMVGIFFSTLFGHIVVVINKQKPMIWGYASVAVLSLIIYPLAIMRYGMFGAAWATVATEFIITIWTFLMVWRATHLIPKLDLFWKSILASLMMGTFLALLPNANLAILLLGGILIYSTALYMLGGIKKQMLQEIIFSKNI